jgi:hypothetical protein
MRLLGYILIVLTGLAFSRDNNFDVGFGQNGTRRLAHSLLNLFPKL